MKLAEGDVGLESGHQIQRAVAVEHDILRASQEARRELYVATARIESSTSASVRRRRRARRVRVDCRGAPCQDEALGNVPLDTVKTQLCKFEHNWAEPGFRL